MNKPPAIVSIAVHFNSPQDCTTLVQSLFQVNYDNHFIIIVDNCSTPELHKQLVSNLSEIISSDRCEIIKNKINDGYGGGINFGFWYALRKYKLDYLHVINTDAEVVNKDYLTALLSILEQDKSIGIIGPAVLKNYEGEIQNTILPFISLKTALNFKRDFSTLSTIDRFPVTRDVECINGVCFLIPVEVFKSIGGFDTSYFMYGEEQDLCYRIYLYGYRRVFWSGLSIIHHGAEKEGDDAIDWRFVHVRKNQVKFIRKHGSFSKSVLLATLFSLSLFSKIIKGNNKLKGETIVSIINQYYSCAFND